MVLGKEDIGTLEAAAVVVEKHPELRKIFSVLSAEKAAIVAKSSPLRAKYDKLVEQIQPLELEARKISEQFHAIERPRLGEIDNQLAALAKGMGGRALSDSNKA